MKRLVYSPSVNVWVRTDTGVFDLSPYVMDFSIDRRVGEVSAAQVTFRNPRVTDERDTTKTRFMFTEHIADDGSVRPMFHPMDPIIITLTRIKGRPIQVFTGYCDTTPYVQLMPGPATLTASCTLKRLLHTYWDPALPFVRDFMLTNGWAVSDNGVAINGPVEQTRGNIQDSSLGSLLFNVLTEVGGWDRNNIKIQALPGTIHKTVVGLYEQSDVYKKRPQGELSEIGKDLNKLFTDIIGASAYGTDAGQVDASEDTNATGTAPVAPDDAPEVIRKWIAEADRIANHITHYDQANPPNTRTVDRIPEKDGAYIFDCSSFISYMMNFIDRYDQSYGQVSGWFAQNYGAAGEGKYLTLWADDGHIVAEVKGKDGPQFIGTSRSVSRASADNSSYGHKHTIGWHNYDPSGKTPRHVPGL